MGSRSTGVEWDRVTRRVLLAGSVLAALSVVIGARDYAGDFHWGAWLAARQILLGHSPYPDTTYAAIFAHPHAFVTPPLLALITAPLTVLPFPVAAGLWSLLSLAAFVGALRLLGVTDPRVIVLCACSYAFALSVGDGQPDGVLALVLAVVWRYRDSWQGAVAVGLLIAAKLVAWPLVLWLLIMRRTRSASLAVGSAIAILLASWSVIGFNGFTSYPQTLQADLRVWGPSSYSILAALMRLGAGEGPARVITVFAAIAISVAVIAIGRRTDLAIFVAAIVLGLLSSPMLRVSYLVPLLLALAISRRELDSVWLLTCALYITAAGLLPNGLAIATALTLTVAIAMSAVRPRLVTAPRAAIRGAPATVSLAHPHVGRRAINAMRRGNAVGLDRRSGTDRRRRSSLGCSEQRGGNDRRQPRARNQRALKLTHA